MLMKRRKLLTIAVNEPVQLTFELRCLKNTFQKNHSTVSYG